MPSLARDEKETIITFDETPNEAIIFTYNKTWQKQLEKKLGLTPTMNNGWGAREYRLPKSRVRMPQPPKKLSVEQRRKMGQRLKDARRQKSLSASKSNAATMKSQGKISSPSDSPNRAKIKSKNPQKSATKKSRA